MTIGHAQYWALAAAFECQHTLFSRSATSLSQGTRIAQMLGLHEIDRQDKCFQSILPPPKDFSELDGIRRTWWVVFCLDRLVAGLTGWPVMINERHVRARSILTISPTCLEPQWHQRLNGTRFIQSCQHQT